MIHVSATARRYGRALAKVAIGGRLEKTVGVELQGLWDYLRDSPVVRLTLESPATTKERRAALVESIVKTVSFSEFTANFLRVLAEERRFGVFREIVEAYRVEVDRYHGTVEVEVTSAQPLDEGQREALRGTLQRSVAGGKDVRLDLKVDPTLLGGALTKVGSVVYDGSLAHQLERLRHQLISE